MFPSFEPCITRLVQVTSPSTCTYVSLLYTSGDLSAERDLLAMSLMYQSNSRSEVVGRTGTRTLLRLDSDPDKMLYIKSGGT